MALFIGRDKLEEAKTTYLNYNQNVIRGIEGELMVGDFLSNYLPSDTYVIAHPQIGKYDPDFLVVSPKYGFRIVEVKNWNLSAIQKAESNGRFVFADGETNPIEQAKLQAAYLNKYINSNYNKDLYRIIGYVVIHIGFCKIDFMSKFSKSWDETQRKDYTSVVFFKDQINSSIDRLFYKATKYNNYSFGPGDKISFINNFVMSVKTQEVHAEQYELSPLSKQESSTKGLKIGIAICLIILVLTSGFYLLNMKDDAVPVNSEVIPIEQMVSEDLLGERVAIVAQVDDFSYDKKSGTKFLKLSNSAGSMEAVIFKNVEVPYINVGETYTFNGVVQEYKGVYELCIDSVAE